MCCNLNKTTRVITAVVSYANGGVRPDADSIENESVFSALHSCYGTLYTLGGVSVCTSA